MLKDKKKIFYHLLSNTLIASVTNAFVWFALTFWVFLETKSVLVTSFIAGTYALSSMLFAFLFGSIVDKHKKHSAMVISSIASFTSYAVGSLIFFLVPRDLLTDPKSFVLWIWIIVLMLGSVFGNLRMIALSTLVTFLFENDRDKANGMVGMVNGIGFTITSALSGAVIGFFGMGTALICALVATSIALIHLLLIHFGEENKIKKEGEHHEHFSLKKTMGVVMLIPGLIGLIFFTTFNNFLGGVFMALMDAYGLSLVSVQVWGTMFAILSLGYIGGSTYVAKYGLGKKPLKTLLVVNAMAWTSCIFFTIQPSIILLGLGMLVWMTISPFAEATEQTVIQNVVPYEKQGRVFGFAQSIESAATPITAFLIGPIAQFIFIPFMTTGRGVDLIGSWFGTGDARGIALVFIISGIVGLSVTLWAFKSKTYDILSKVYSDSQKEKSSV